MTIIQLDTDQLRALIQSTLLEVLEELQGNGNKEPIEKILSVKEAAEFLGIQVPTIYSKVSKNELPVMKRNNKLYFSSIELTEYLKGGRKLTNNEIEQVANKILTNKKGLK